MRELLSPLSTGTIEFSEKPIGLSRSSIVKGNRESVVPQAGRGEIWLDSTDRFLRIDRSGVKARRRGYPLAREEASARVFVIGTRARSRRSVRAYSCAGRPQ